MGPIFSLTAKKKKRFFIVGTRSQTSFSVRIEAAQLLGHLAGQCLGLIHLSLRTVGGDSRTCNANRAISTSPQQGEHSFFYSLHLPETSPTATTNTMTILTEQGLIHSWIPPGKKLPRVCFVYSMLQFAVKQLLESRAQTCRAPP